MKVPHHRSELGFFDSDITTEESAGLLIVAVADSTPLASVIVAQTVTDPPGLMGLGVLVGPEIVGGAVSPRGMPGPPGSEIWPLMEPSSSKGPPS